MGILWIVLIVILVLALLGVFSRGRRQGFGPHNGFDGTINAIVAVDACQVPLHHLGDGVFVLGVVTM